MTRTITPTKDLSKKATEEKLRAEMADLERAIERLPLSKQTRSHEFELLTQKCNRLKPSLKIHPSQFESPSKIDSCDSTLRHAWGDTRFDFYDIDPLDKTESAGFCG